MKAEKTRLGKMLTVAVLANAYIKVLSDLQILFFKNSALLCTVFAGTLLFNVTDDLKVNPKKKVAEEHLLHIILLTTACWTKLVGFANL